MSKRIAIGGDHAGFAYKEQVVDYLKSKGYLVDDFGPESEASCDYADFVHPLAQSMVEGKNDVGIVICGSGNGVNMTANKYPQLRAGLCWTKELAELTRAHNDANVLSIPARFVSIKVATEMVEAFLTTEFEGGRHQRRVDKITEGIKC